MSTATEDLSIRPTEDVPPIVIGLETEGHLTIFHLNAHLVYFRIRALISKLTGETKTADQNLAAKQLAALVKVAVKGVLMLYGDRILELALGKEHPRPGKKDDLVEWYSDMLTKIGIAWLVKHPTDLHGHIIDGQVIDGHTVEIDTINSRSDSAGTRTLTSAGEPESLAAG